MHLLARTRVRSLYTNSGSYVLKRTALDALCTQVGGDYLMRCHKSFALNINAIKEILPEQRRNWMAVFQNGIRCPVSQTYYSVIRLAYFNKMTK